METRKLYYEDCHLRQFTATVTGCTETEKGWEIVLDQTAFYPEGGGQACDLGTICHCQVLDVQEQGEQVVHLCDAPLIPGEQVDLTKAAAIAHRFDGVLLFPQILCSHRLSPGAAEVIFPHRTSSGRSCGGWGWDPAPSVPGNGPWCRNPYGSQSHSRGRPWPFLPCMYHG